ncbi:MAG TPA: hypothetical protein VG318_18780 [Actinomycetota bacterium]|nr:hypothetical protein [Actinomycetota bacterium]
MSKRWIALPLGVAVLGALLAGATAAQAENCVGLPGTTGATIEAGGQEIRVPATSGVAACIQTPGLPGLPRVDSGGGTVSIVLGAGSGTSGYVVVRYTLDGVYDEVRVPIPGGGGGTETCLASVGEIVRPDCLVKVSIDDIPDPGPVPTVPPTPTLRPLPTVSPKPLPTIGPIDDPWCNQWYCIQDPPDPWCNQWYCFSDPPPIVTEPICLTKPAICVS